MEKHNIIDALGHLALILTYVSAFIVRGDESDFVHERFPVWGYGVFICFLYVVILPAPVVYYHRKEKRSDQESSKHASANGEQATFSNPLSGDVLEDESVYQATDAPTGANINRVAIAKLQRKAKETRDALNAKEIENEAQRAEIQDLRDQVSKTANHAANSNIATTQSRAGADGSTITNPAPVGPPDVLRAFVDDETLDEETREAARSVIVAQATSQIDTMAMVASRASKISELNDERRFKDRYSNALAAVQSNDADMVTAATEWAAFRTWLGTYRLLRHEAHMGKVLGRDAGLGDLKLLEQQDIDELSSEMTRVEQARFTAAVRALQDVEE